MNDDNRGVSSWSHLPEHQPALLAAPIGHDVKDTRALAANQTVLHLCVLADVGVHGSDHAHNRAGRQRLLDPELVERCRKI